MKGKCELAERLVAGWLAGKLLASPLVYLLCTGAGNSLLECSGWFVGRRQCENKGEATMDGTWRLPELDWRRMQPSIGGAHTGTAMATGGKSYVSMGNYPQPGREFLSLGVMVVVFGFTC